MLILMAGDLVFARNPSTVSWGGLFVSVARNPLQHEQILGGGRTHISMWQRCSCRFSLVFMCHEWCRF